MAEKKNDYSPGVEADRRLLPFETWENYLDSLIEVADLCNLRSAASARTIASLGYRASGDTLGEKEFDRRRAVIHGVVYPSLKAYVLVSENTDCEEPFIRELAIRERANRCGILQVFPNGSELIEDEENPHPDNFVPEKKGEEDSMDCIYYSDNETIIFLRHFTKCGFEISGYIDYAHRLIGEDWSPYFKSGRRVWPRPSDLGYFHWRHGTVKSNISRNYKPLMDPERGLLFQNRHDHKIICPDPNHEPGQNSMRMRIHSPKYTQIEIYDHVARKKT